jgi:hypothetical protein
MKIVSLVNAALIAWLSASGIVLYSLGSTLGGLEGLILSVIAVGNGQIAGFRLGLYLRDRKEVDAGQFLKQL